MTRTEMAINAAIYHLKAGPSSCSNLGIHLWGKSDSNRKPQAFARPAGKLLHAMKQKGMVETYFDATQGRSMWRLRAAWRTSSGSTSLS